MTKALIFGGSGFIGGHLCQGLVDRGYGVVIASRGAIGKIGAANVDRVTCDIVDSAAVDNVIASQRPTLIINLSTPPPHSGAQDLFETNLGGAINVLSAARDSRLDAKLILFGSAAEYGPQSVGQQPVREDARCSPVGGYGNSKLAMTIAAMQFGRRYGLNVDIVRPFNVLGPGCPKALLVGAILDRIRHAQAVGGPIRIKVGRTDTARDFLAVDDLVAAILTLAARRGPPEIYNVCGGTPVRIDRLLDAIRQVTQLPIEWVTDPALVRPDDVLVSYGDGGKIAVDTGFRPTHDLDGCLRAMWQHLLTGEG